MASNSPQLSQLSSGPSPQIPTPNSVLSLSTKHNTPVSQGALRLLGSIIGLDNNLIAKFSLEKADSHSQFFQAIQHPRLRTQHALLLLRACALPRMNFLCRTLAPRLTLDACNLFDTLVSRAAVTILKLSEGNLSQVAQHQLSMPLRQGGLGLRQTVIIAPAAFLGSIADSSPFLYNVSRSDPPPHSEALLEDLTESYRVLGLPSPRIKLPNPPNFIQHFSHPQHAHAKLQHSLSFFLAKTFLNSTFKPLLSPLEQAHFTSLSQRCSSLWLTTPPGRPEYQMSDDDFLLAIRYRLRLPPASPCPSTASVVCPTTFQIIFLTVRASVVDL